MAYKAIHYFAPIAATKVRPIAALIRKKSVEEAKGILKFMHNRGARLLEKVLASAAANAEDRGARDATTLTVIEARVDEGPRLKRIQPRARGMAFMILKRLSHIHVSIE